MLGLEDPPSAPNGDVLALSFAKPELAKADDGAAGGSWVLDGNAAAAPSASFSVGMTFASAPPDSVCGAVDNWPP